MKIASRILRLRRGGVQDEVPIQIFAPRPDGRAWSCQYEIGWPGGARRRSIFGLDGVQALLLAFEAIGAEIYTSDHHASGQLLWEREGRGYGFPVPQNIRDLLIGDDAASQP
jgi:hypothetical protein